jgi:hypothetical protein
VIIINQLQESDRKTTLNLPSDSNKNSRAFPLSHLMVGRISKTCVKQNGTESETSLVLYTLKILQN